MNQRNLITVNKEEFRNNDGNIIRLTKRIIICTNNSHHYQLPFDSLLCPFLALPLTSLFSPPPSFTIYHYACSLFFSFLFFFFFFVSFYLINVSTYPLVHPPRKSRTRDQTRLRRINSLSTFLLSVRFSLSFSLSLSLLPVLSMPLPFAVRRSLDHSSRARPSSSTCNFTPRIIHTSHLQTAGFSRSRYYRYNRELFYLQVVANNPPAPGSKNESIVFRLNGTTRCLVSTWCARARMDASNWVQCRSEEIQRIKSVNMPERRTMPAVLGTGAFHFFVSLISFNPRHPVIPKFIISLVVLCACSF